MKSAIIDQYVQQNLREIASQDELQEFIRQRVAAGIKVTRAEIPVRGGIGVFLHPIVANYVPGAELHSHDYFELVYVYRGTASQHMEHGQQRMEEGSVCLMNTNYRHGLSIPSEDSVVFDILITSEVLNSSFLNLIAGNELFSRFFITALFSSSDQGEYVYFARNPESRMETLMQSLVEEYILDKPCCQTAMQAYLSLVFTELLRSHVYVTDKHGERDNEFFAMLSYISSNLETVTLNGLAERFHYTPAHLSKLLKQHLGKGFASLVGDLKLEKAARYLTEDPAMSIDSIVEALGYYDRSYFNRVFRKRYGVSPSEYRGKRGK